MGAHQIIKTEGEDLVVLPRADYEALLARAGAPTEAEEDAWAVRALERSNAEIARGEDLALPGDVWDAIEAAPHPLAPVRKWRGLTQQQLSAAAGVAQPYISEVEKGRKEPSRRVLEKLAAALGVPLGHLVKDAAKA